MIILDTNVISELMRPDPNERMIAWLDRQDRAAIWATSITFYEVRFGIERSPAGRKRDLLSATFERLTSVVLKGQVLPFDTGAAEAAAILSARRRAAGRTIDIRDTQIAGIALARRAGIATRNVRDFADLSVPVVDPWAA